VLAEATMPYRSSHPRLRIHTQAAYADRAEQALIEASAGKTLTVVGSRGRGGIASALLGSASRALTHYAHSPVAIIHPAY
jgi:nucleotide-binding universal stress UspA family protein